MKEQTSNRFHVALSFPGEHRDFVLQVAEELAKKLTHDRVFYDEWYEVDLLGSSGDLKLQSMYEQADLVVPFFSKYYSKPWCSLEWETIRGILFHKRQEDKVIPVHLDDTKVLGWSAVNVGIRLRGRSPQEIADVILQALDRRINPSSKTTSEVTPLPELEYKVEISTQSPISQDTTSSVSDPKLEEVESEKVKLCSERGVDYSKLRDLLATEKWKEADRETADRMLHIIGKEGWWDVKSPDIYNFPCKDLRTIDQLWVKYSKGRFGFSVQKKIWQEVGGKVDYETEKKLGDRVGWRIGDNWLSYDELTFNLNAPLGHLPLGWKSYLPFFLSGGIYLPFWLSRVIFSSLARRAVNCKI